MDRIEIFRNKIHLFLRFHIQMQLALDDVMTYGEINFGKFLRL